MKQKILLSSIFVIVTPNLFSQVGINTNNPTHTLDVDGEVRVRKIEDSLPNEINYSLVSDKSGVIKKISSKTENSYAFNYATYKINNVNGDWVQDLDTKIPSYRICSNYGRIKF